MSWSWRLPSYTSCRPCYHSWSNSLQKFYCILSWAPVHSRCTFHACLQSSISAALGTAFPVQHSFSEFCQIFFEIRSIIYSSSIFRFLLLVKCEFPGPIFFDITYSRVAFLNSWSALMTLISVRLSWSVRKLRSRRSSLGTGCFCSSSSQTDRSLYDSVDSCLCCARRCSEPVADAIITRSPEFTS